MTKYVWVALLSLGLAGSQLASADDDDKVKKDIKIEAKEGSEKYKEKTKVRNKGSKVHEDSKIKSKDEFGTKYEEKTKVRGHGDEIKTETETKVKEKN